jgi:hypothetical protein
MKAQIWKGGMQVTPACALTKEVTLSGFEDVGDIQLYYFARIQLLPPLVFQHMCGRGLNTWFEESDLKKEDGTEIKGLRYVHGRSEVMRGSASISAILLAKFESVDPKVLGKWMAYLPEIYRRFSLLE